MLSDKAEYIAAAEAKHKKHQKEAKKRKEELKAVS
jgi:hypothetical protein